MSSLLLGADMPMFDTGVDTAPEAAIASMIAVYLIAALFNLYIPRTEAPLQPLARGMMPMVRDFAACNARLWHDNLHAQLVNASAPRSPAWWPSALLSAPCSRRRACGSTARPA